jgi:hypothetical protein
LENITIIDHKDRRFPFERKIFEDPYVLYHGSWSSWSSRIEADGFVHGRLPFDWRHVATVFRANQAIGRGSYLRMFLGKDYPNELPARDLFLSANFWCARAYATDSGGEVIRNTVEEAEQFELECSTPQRRIALENHWKHGLRLQPEHLATRAAVDLLEDDKALNQLLSEVKAAKEALIALTAGGHAIVYAIRVEPTWVAKDWNAYVSKWTKGIREVDLRCLANIIHSDRLLAKVTYPNGTEQDFIPAVCRTWEDVVEFARL